VVRRGTIFVMGPSSMIVVSSFEETTSPLAFPSNLSEAGVKRGQYSLFTATGHMYDKHIERQYRNE
jgi:hypothetical protein